MADLVNATLQDDDLSGKAFPSWFRQQSLQSAADIQASWSGGTQDAEEYFLVSDRGVLGTCGLVINPPHRLYKAPDAVVGWPQISILKSRDRGQGVGRAAFSHLLRRARARGVTHIEIGVFPQNELMLQILSRKGFGAAEIGAAGNGSRRFLIEIEDGSFGNDRPSTDFAR